MRPVKIITDSCADIGKDLREKYDIDYARMQTTYKGKEQRASLDFEYYTPKELYNIMRNGERVFTNQVPAEEFEKIFSKYLTDGFNIVYIGCSLKLSGSVNTGEVVAKKLLANYPDAEIYCIDSKNSCMAEGALAIRASEYAKQGMSAKEVADRITAERKKINMFVTVHSLDCLKRAGKADNNFGHQRQQHTYQKGKGACRVSCRDSGTAQRGCRRYKTGTYLHSSR